MPNPNLPINNLLNDETLKALKLFKEQWYSRVGRSLTIGDPYYEVNYKVWTVIGLALGKDRLIQSLRNTNDYELRNLLMGMGNVNSMSFVYTKEMESCDVKIASVFGGKNAVAAANGFEPYSLAIVRKFHFLYDVHLTTDSIHLYGSLDGTRFGVDGYTIVDLYVPDGFSHPEKVRKFVSPTQASVNFYYERLGNYEDVTLLVSHIKDFKLKKEENRWHIGKIGGIGGDSSNYFHSHLDLFKGNVGMTGKRNRVSFSGAFC